MSDFNQEEKPGEQQAGRKAGPEDCKPYGWWDDRSLGMKILMGIGIGILVLGGLGALGLVTMALWNWLMPEIFGLKTIDYWQAWGLLALSTILFKGFGSGESHNRGTERKRKRHLRRYLQEEAK